MNIENSQGIITTGGKVDIHNPTLNFSPHSPIQPVKQFPYRDNPNFVGREAQLTALQQQLQQPEIVAISAVAGMGGVGKTELASRYSHKHQGEYPGGICWLDARGENLAGAIVQFAQNDLKLEVPQKDVLGNPLNLTQQVAWCWQHWQPPEGLVLVILDDVTDLAHCRDFFPTSNRFRILITTRLRHLDPNIREIPLDVLSEEEALQLLTALDVKRVQREPETAQELCKWLGYLPLGIELVGRYLAKKPPQWTLAKILERLKTQSIEDEALNQELYKTLSTAQRGVKAAFELSWQELEPHTQEIAQFLSLFAPSVIAWEWVEAAASQLSWHTEDVETANWQLYERHLINLVEDGEQGYNIHPLIRQFLQTKLAVSGQAEKLQTAFADIFVAIAQTIPGTLTLEKINSVKDAIPQLVEVAENLLHVVSDDNLMLVFVVGLGLFYKEQGLYNLAAPWLEQCVSELKSRLGAEHPDVATSLNNLARLYDYQGRYKEAESLYLQALEMRQRLLGAEHPDVATSLSNLATLYHHQGRYEQAEPLDLQALKMYKRLLGAEHPYVATSLNNLAILYHHQGRYKEAESLYLQALKIYKRLLGAEHPDVAQSLNNLATYCVRKLNLCICKL
ncbi:NB-ARC domain protein [Richelia sinica FACHB-800]|uniref:NB-ARC domain protein n=1 Tax=Richelia sinica FACHB-800 TaxID=1357546 RepID=A0A975T6S2_9NOST|nr:NB-ARC domain protein [Richelia sinica FACHB-800]